MKPAGRLALAGSVGAISTANVVGALGFATDVVLAASSLLAALLSLAAIVAELRELRRGGDA